MDEFFLRNRQRKCQVQFLATAQRLWDQRLVPEGKCMDNLKKVIAITKDSVTEDGIVKEF